MVEEQTPTTQTPTTPETTPEVKTQAPAVEEKAPVAQPPAATKEDLEALKNDLGTQLREEITTSVAEKLANTLRGESPDSKKYDYADAPWVLQRRNPSYEEVVDFVDKKRALAEESLVEKAKTAVIEELNGEQDEYEKGEAEKKAQNEAAQKAVTVQWNREFARLEEQGKIPRMVKADDPNDPGFRARQILYDRVNQNILALQSQGKGNEIVPADYSVEVAYYRGGTAGPASQAGRNAPVAGIRRGAVASPGGPVGYKYSDLKKPWHELLAK